MTKHYFWKIRSVKRHHFADIGPYSQSCGFSSSRVWMWELDCKEGKGNPLQYSCLENPMDREDWWATVHGVTKSRTRLSDFTFTFMCGCESWTIKKAECWRIDAFKLWCWRRHLRIPWTARRSNQSLLKEINISWIFIGRTDTEAEALILWPPDANSWLIGKDPDAGKYWRQEEKGAIENEMVGWHHQLDGHESEQTPRDREEWGNVAHCNPRGLKEPNMI